MTDASSAPRASARTRFAIAFAVLGFVGSAALLGFEGYLAVTRTGFEGLAVAVTHVLYGWIPAALALVGLILRRTRLTIGAMIVAVVILVVSPVLLVIF